jgi:hypothetical protein
MIHGARQPNSKGTKLPAREHEGRLGTLHGFRHRFGKQRESNESRSLAPII